jgi:hypothetical protein
LCLWRGQNQRAAAVLCLRMDARRKGEFLALSGRYFVIEFQTGDTLGSLYFGSENAKGWLVWFVDFSSWVSGAFFSKPKIQIPFLFLHFL